MRYLFNLNSTIIVLLLTIVIVAVHCVPTSVLADAKESKVKHHGLDIVQVKPEQIPEGINNNVKKENNNPQKRGVNPLLYNEAEFRNDYSGNSIPNGVWEDINNPAIYPELMDGNFERLYDANHQKTYDNLQNLLSQQYYNEPVALPVEYPYRYYSYGDRKKRSSNQKHKSRVSRLKRASNKMSPADVLSLLALMEAREETQQYPIGDFYPLTGDSPNDVLSYSPNSVYPEIPMSALEQLGRGTNEDNGEWMNTWTEPAVEFYGMPMDMEAMPRYESMNMKYPKLGIAAHKRFMVSKKKRDIKEDCRKKGLGEYMCLMKLYEKDRNMLQMMP